MDLINRYTFRINELNNRYRIRRMADQIAKIEKAATESRPVAFFNASSRMHYLSQNAAFSMLASWGLRLSGNKVVHFVCQAGMSRCMLGTNKDDLKETPPCQACIAASNRFYHRADTFHFSYQENSELVQLLASLSVEQMINFSYQDLPLGEIVLPGLRWILRLHTLADSQETRFLFRELIFSAFNVAQNFDRFLDENDPSLLVLFNGQMFPEATAKHIAKSRNIPVITHEVGLMPLTGFFTHGEATAYPIDIPETFELSKAQNARLDEYLEKRFQGKFSMAGVEFWPEIHELDETLLTKIDSFKQIIPIFTNVIFDTSQPHANVIFEHMFEWLDFIRNKVSDHPDTLFILRAHPDENRPGKASRESVAQWVNASGFAELPNTLFIDADQYLSSYALIQRSKFMMVYNSSIGLEGTLMGIPVLSAGKARYTRYPTVFFPDSRQTFSDKFDEMLQADSIEIPSEFIGHARKFLYYQLFRTSLPFDDFLLPHVPKGYVRLKPIKANNLSPKNSKTIKTILDGILLGGSLLLEEDE